MLNAIKRALGRTTTQELAAAELAEAELKLLEAQSGREFAEAMVGYHTRRIARLRTQLATPSLAMTVAAAANEPRMGQDSAFAAS